MKLYFSLIKLYCATALLLTLGACAWQIQTGKYWQPEPGWTPNKVIRVHTVSVYAGVTARHYDGWHTKQKDGSCDIFIHTAAKDRECTEKHERKHCAGFTHDTGSVFNACWRL